MKKYRLNATFAVVGGFWLPDKPAEPMTGNLRADRGRVRLLRSPSFKELTDDELRQAWLTLGAMDDAPRIAALCGHTKDGRCTLLHLVAEIGRGVTDLAHKVEIRADSWSAGSAVMGLHLKSTESEEIDGGTFYFTKIERWLPSAWALQITEERFTYTSTHRPSRVFEFSSIPLEAQVICEVCAVSGKKIKSVPRIRIVPKRPRSLEWFAAIGPRLENFFALFLGTSVSLKRLQLFQGKDGGWVVRKMQRRKQKIDLQSWIRCGPDQLGRALENWFAVPEERRPVEIAVLGMLRKSSLFVETEFLGLAQALEGFGRLHFEGGLIPANQFKEGLVKVRGTLNAIWGDSEIAKRCYDSVSNANEDSYAQRIQQTYDLVTPALATKLLGERSQFVRQVVQTRNYFTHLGIRKGTSVVDPGKDLFLLNQRLHAFLRCIMLIDLGIPEAVLTEPILYQARRWR